MKESVGGERNKVLRAERNEIKCTGTMALGQDKGPFILRD